MLKFFFFLHVYFCFFNYGALIAKSGDSTSLSIGKRSIISKRSYLPFFLFSNQRGQVQNNQLNFLISGVLHYKTKISDKFVVEAGTELVYEILSKNGQFNQIYTKTSFGPISFKAGRWHQNWGYNPELGTGSFGISNNAVPIPSISLGLQNFISVPFTNGFLEIKGEWLHGWFEKERHVSKAWMHAKNFYLKAGGSKINTVIGLNHFAQWAGQHPEGEMPDNWLAYWQIITGSPQTDTINYSGPANTYNALGNHMAIWDIKLNFNLSNHIFNLYTQSIFDRGFNQAIYGRDKINYLNLFDRDRLIGLQWKLLDQKYVDEVLLEFINTRYQGGPGLFIGQFNYYNNALYASGWSYLGRIIGTPLFLNQSQIDDYQLSTALGSSRGIISNRIRAFHFGYKGTINQQWNIRMRQVLVSHYGNYFNDKDFKVIKNQLFGIITSEFKLTDNIAGKCDLSYDYGQLSKNLAVEIGVEINLL